MKTSGLLPKIGVLLLATTLAGCGIIETHAPQIDAKGFGGDPRVRAVRDAITWIKLEIQRAPSRNFSFAPERLDYRGHRAELEGQVASLRQDAARFNAGQAFLATVMSDARWLPILEKLNVAIETPENIARRLGAHDDAALENGTFFVSARKVDEISGDPRAFLVFVAHHMLHALGFKGDEAPADGPLAVPAPLASGTNGVLLWTLTLPLVLLSNDYRFALAGDDPEPSGIPWVNAFDDDFGGPGGVAIPARNVSSQRWVVGTRNKQRQVDGYLTNAVDLGSSDNFDVTTLVASSDVRVSLDVVGGRALGDHTLTLGHRATATVSLNPQSTAIGGNGGYGGSVCSATVPATPRGELVVSFVGELVILRWNGAVACQFRVTASDARPVVLQGTGMRIDRARVDRVQ